MEYVNVLIVNFLIILIMVKFIFYHFTTNTPSLDSHEHININKFHHNQVKKCIHINRKFVFFTAKLYVIND